MCHCRFWSDEKTQFLMDKWGELDIGQLSKKLDKSVSAIRSKANSEGLPKLSDCLDGITINDLAEVFNIEVCVIKDEWMKNLGMKCKRKLLTEKKPYTYINLVDFWKWAEANKEKIDFSKLEKNILGAEPSWVFKKRLSDIQSKMSYGNFSEF